MEFTLKKRESRFIKGNLFITELFGNGKKGNNVSFFFFFFYGNEIINDMCFISLSLFVVKKEKKKRNFYNNC